MADDSYHALIDSLPSELDMRFLYEAYPYIIIDGAVQLDELGMTDGALHDSEGYVDLNSADMMDPVNLPVGGSSWHIQYWAPDPSTGRARICASGGNARCQAVDPILYSQSPNDEHDTSFTANTPEVLALACAGRVSQLAIQQGWKDIRIVEGNEIMKFMIWAVAELNHDAWSGQVTGYEAGETERERFGRVKEMLAADFLYEVQHRAAATPGASTSPVASTAQKAEAVADEPSADDQVEVSVEAEQQEEAKPEVPQESAEAPAEKPKKAPAKKKPAKKDEEGEG